LGKAEQAANDKPSSHGTEFPIATAAATGGGSSRVVMFDITAGFAGTFAGFGVFVGRTSVTPDGYGASAIAQT